MNRAQSTQLYAAIDLGSNSFHMLVAREVEGSVQTVAKIKRKVRLAAGLDQNNLLDDAAMQRGWDCLQLFAEQLQDIAAENIRIVGTATLRVARNIDHFLQHAEQILAHPIEVISGEEEAATIYKGVAYTSSGKGNRLVIDIGGASTELIVGEGAEAKVLYSLKMGCVTWLNQHFSDGVLTEVRFKAAIEAAKQQLLPVLPDYARIGWQSCVGASGTVQALQELLINQGLNETITLEKLHHLKAQAIAFGTIDKLEWEGLQEERRPVFPSGLAILIAIFELMEVENMILAGGALREGMIYEMIGQQDSNNVRAQTVNSLMQRYQIEAAHAECVKNTALQALDQLKVDLVDLEEQAGPILAYAARLHEIGLGIEYKNAPKHAAYIIDHATMPGFTSAQKQLLSALLVNQRGAIQRLPLQLQSATSESTAILLCRLLRLAIVFAMRRNQGTIPNFRLSLSGKQLSLYLPAGWRAQHALRAAQLALEAQAQAELGYPLLMIDEAQ